MESEEGMAAFPLRRYGECPALGGDRIPLMKCCELLRRLAHHAWRILFRRGRRCSYRPVCRSHAVPRSRARGSSSTKHHRNRCGRNPPAVSPGAPPNEISSSRSTPGTRATPGASSPGRIPHPETASKPHAAPPCQCGRPSRSLNPARKPPDRSPRCPQRPWQQFPLFLSRQIRCRERGAPGKGNLRPRNPGCQ